MSLELSILDTHQPRERCHRCVSRSRMYCTVLCLNVCRHRVLQAPRRCHSPCSQQTFQNLRVAQARLSPPHRGTLVAAEPGPGQQCHPCCWRHRDQSPLVALSSLQTLNLSENLVTEDGAVTHHHAQPQSCGALAPADPGSARQSHLYCRRRRVPISRRFCRRKVATSALDLRDSSPGHTVMRPE
jgi:hypothetical protein